MAVDHLEAEPLTDVNLRLLVLAKTGLELDHVELEVIERGPHVVELVLGLDDDLVEAVVEGPRLLLLRERAKEPLPPPVSTRPAEPAIQHLPASKLDAVSELRNKIRKLRVSFVKQQLVRYLVGNGYDGRAVVRQWGLRHEYLVIAVGQTLDYVGRPLGVLKLTEVLFDVLDLKRALVQRILADLVFHGRGVSR